MDEVLYLKFRQHKDLRGLLFNTYSSYLIYAEPDDPFWGDGGGTGMNEFGNSLMRVRKRLRREMDNVPNRPNLPQQYSMGYSRSSHSPYQ
jgi:hypothetical protein